MCHATEIDSNLLQQLAIPCVCLVTQLCLTLCDPMDCRPPGSSVHMDSPGKNTGVGCHALFQGIFPTQGLNPGLLHYRQILYCLSHGGKLYIRVPLPDLDWLPVGRLYRCLAISGFLPQGRIILPTPLIPDLAM